METCTLLVRLAGLWLFGKSWLVLHEVLQAKSMMGSSAGNSFAVQKITTYQAYAIFGLIIGVAAIVFAGALSRVLTFDAKPSQQSLLDQ